MNTIKHVLLKGNENFLDHTKSVALYGKLYWRKSNKKLHVGDIVYLFMSGKGHCQIRYKLEVTNNFANHQKILLYFYSKYLSMKFICSSLSTEY